MKRAVIVSVPLVITLLVWLGSVPLSALESGEDAMQLIGALALVGFGVVMMLATHWRALDRLFDGQDKAFVVHKWLGVVSVGFVLVHLLAHNGMPGHGGFGPGHGVPGMGGHGSPPFGEIAAILLIVLIVLAFIARAAKYETWRFVHRIMALAYVAALAHYYLTSTLQPLGFTPFSVWIDITAMFGVASAIYSVFLYEWLAFRHRYRVVAVRRLSPDVVEITGQATNSPMALKPGQFAFAKFPQSKFKSHPFTISGTPALDTLQLTIKDLGDDTHRLIESVATGDPFAMSGPFGCFDYTLGGDHQAWVAGGIGVTPFRCFLGAPVPEHIVVDFFYCYHGAAQAVYADELANTLGANVRLHLVDDTIDGFLTPQRILELCPTMPSDVYFCGPVAMRRSLQPGLTAGGVRFHYEQFQFR